LVQVSKKFETYRIYYEFLKDLHDYE
jgi:hypothetical protein